MADSLFEQLKKKSTFHRKERSADQVFFQLLFDEYGAYLEVVDARLKLIEVDYRQYSGSVREVLRSLESIGEKNSFIIDWEKTPDQVYLADHDYLLWQLRLCPNVVDEAGKPLRFETEEGRVIARIEAEDAHIFRCEVC
jgi:hypothetical protein